MQFIYEVGEPGYEELVRSHNGAWQAEKAELLAGRQTGKVLGEASRQGSQKSNEIEVQVKHRVVRNRGNTELAPHVAIALVPHWQTE